MEPIQAILIGAGQRGGEVYGAYALRHPDHLRFIAVAEPDPERRARFARQHRIPPENQFPSWEPLVARLPMSAAAFVCTQDWQHTAPALAALQRGYHVLLEKPMATSAQDCRRLVLASEEGERQLHIAHVLRYTRHFSKMREILQSPELGQIITVDHRENVSWWHMAHSFVRGNWRSSQESSPMILAKCCHDFDILLWLLDKKCQRLSSHGSLRHYRSENAPGGAPEFCLQGCPVSESCPYYAPFIYLDVVPLWRAVAFTSRRFSLPGLATRLQLRSSKTLRLLSRVIPALRRVSEYRGWPISVVAHDPSRENLLEALRDGPYGRCVYHCNNDVVDHQVVAMEFEGGVSVTLTMHGHSHLEGRTTRIQGSRAELQAFFAVGGSWIEVREHRSGRTTRYDTSADLYDGHGGGDAGLIAGFLHSLRDGGQHARTTARQSLESHLLAFAAEQARLAGQVLTVRE